MIPARFDYHRPADVAVRARAPRRAGRRGRRARRRPQPHPDDETARGRTGPHLVDLQDVVELRGIARVGSDLAIGAMVTQHELLSSALEAEEVPLLREAAQQIADPQVRHLGTVGGNVANGDPGNDMPGLIPG